MLSFHSHLRLEEQNKKITIHFLNFFLHFVDTVVATELHPQLKDLHLSTFSKQKGYFKLGKTTRDTWVMPPYPEENLCRSETKFKLQKCPLDFHSSEQEIFI